jgi:hypothetical protein
MIPARRCLNAGLLHCARRSSIAAATAESELFLASLAVVTRVEDYYRCGDETHDEAAGAPLQPHSDRVAEEDDHDGDRDQRDDHGMSAEALHRLNRRM